jgi:hypothetical protein
MSVSERLIQRTKILAEWLDRPDLEPDAQIGSWEAFAQFKTAMWFGALHNRQTGEHCLAGLHPQLAPFEGKQVEVTHPNGIHEKFQISRSLGWFPSTIGLHDSMLRKGRTITPDEIFASIKTIGM